MQVNGEISNIKQHLLRQLEALYELAVPVGQVSTRELDEAMLAITQQLGREVAVYLNRQGRVQQVSVGDTATVDLPEVKSRRSEMRLSGLRCIHTHPSGDPRLSEPDLSSLRQLRFDCMVAIATSDAPHGGIIGSIGFLTGELADDGTEQLSQVGPLSERSLHEIDLAGLVTAINKRLSASTTRETAPDTERALLAGLDCGKADWPAEESLAELARLADTAGAVVVGTFIQRREKPDGAFFLGRGKVSELAMEAQNRDATLLILDDELTPSQQHNLEQMLGLKVIDRTALILDIFAQRARTREGKLQVELAQLQYNLPRLGGQGLVLSRLGGGIGTRGPGETKLEVDRRRIYARIHELEQQIDAVQRNRQLHRRQRRKSRLPLVALVGYTNAGKSTLLNKLTGADVLAEDKLFATLDTTTRHLTLPQKQEILLTDTVGFIQKLPHTLVKAFRATLEEVQEADLLLHVVDSSNENYEQQIAAVLDVLRELEADDKPMIYVFNKSDRIASADQRLAMLYEREGLCVSAQTGENLPELEGMIEHFFKEQQVTMHLLIPYDKGSVLAELHDLDAVRQTEYRPDGTFVHVTLPQSQQERFEPYQAEQ